MGQEGPSGEGEGEVSEWFMVLVLKTSVSNDRGFESLPLRKLVIAHFYYLKFTMLRGYTSNKNTGL